MFYEHIFNRSCRITVLLWYHDPSKILRMPLLIRKDKRSGLDRDIGSVRLAHSVFILGQSQILCDAHTADQAA